MSKKPPTEAESRANLLGWARRYGCEADLQKLFARVDNLLKGARTQEERNAIGAWGIQEIDQFFGGKGEYALTQPVPPSEEDLRVKK